MSVGNALAVVRRHAAEGALINLAVFGSAEGQTVVLELDDRGNRFAAHILDGVLIAKPIRTFNGVVHVPPSSAPYCREAETPPCAATVTAGRENLRYAGGLKPASAKPTMAQAERRRRQRPRLSVVNNFQELAMAFNLNAILSTAKPAVIAAKCNEFLAHHQDHFNAFAVDVISITTCSPSCM